MAKVIDYYLAVVSPYAYLGHDRLVALAEKYGASIAVKPIDLGAVFPVSGGLPLAKRAPQRQAYRLVELRRWSTLLGKPMHVEPQFFPVSGDLATSAVLAAQERGEAAAVALVGAVGRAIWEQQRNIADAATVEALANECGLPGSALMERAKAPEIAAKYAAFTQEAIARGVFGSPTYFYRDELFWGQDRLDFVARALAQ